MNDWILSQTCPGYREKTIQRGAATIVIRRPVLSEEEQTKRGRHALDVLGVILHDRQKRSAI